MLLISNGESGSGLDQEEVIMSIMQQIIIRNTSAAKTNPIFVLNNIERSGNDSNRLENELIRIEKEYLIQESAVLRAYGIRLLFHNICQAFPISAWYIGCKDASNNHRPIQERVWKKLMILCCQSLCDIDSYVYLTAILIVPRIYWLLIHGKESEFHDHPTECSEDRGNGMLLFFIRLYTNTNISSSATNKAAYILDSLTIDAIVSSIPGLDQVKSVSGEKLRHIQSQYRLRMMISEILQQLSKKAAFFPSTTTSSNNSNTTYTVQSLQHLFLQCIQYSKFSIQYYLKESSSPSSTSSAKNDLKSNITKSVFEELLKHINIFTGMHVATNPSEVSAETLNMNQETDAVTSKEWNEEEHQLLEQLYLRQSAMTLLAELVILPLPYHISNSGGATGDVRSRLVDTFPSTEYLFDLLDICQGILLFESSYAVYDRTARRFVFFFFFFKLSTE
jgi:hypothetical protein